MSHVTPAMETTLHLLVGSTIVVLTGYLFAFFARTAKTQSLVWKSITLAMLCLMLLELTGTSEGLSLLSRQLLMTGTETSHSGRGDDAVFKSTQHTQPDPQRISEMRSEVNRDGPGSGVVETVPHFATVEYQHELGQNVAGEETVLRASTTAPEPRLETVALHVRPSAIEELVAQPPAREAGQHTVTWLVHCWPSIWLAGTLLCLSRAALCAIYVVRLRGGLSPVDKRLQQRLETIQKRIGIRRPIRMFTHPRVTTPIVTGTIHPSIVVPVNFASEFATEQQDSIFAHELSHLAAYDNFWLEASLFMSALCWWCPAVWCARRRLRTAMEMAADEASLCVPDGPRHLADCLIKVGRRLTARHHFAALGMAGRGTCSSLATRVRRLLRMSNESPQPPQAQNVARVAVVFLFLFSSVLPSVVVRAEQPFSNGETGMQLLKQSWRHSLLAGIAGAFMVPSFAAAQDVEVEIEYREDDDEHEERTVRVERRREGGDREVIERVHEREIVDPVSASRKLHRELAQWLRDFEREMRQPADGRAAEDGTRRQRLQRRLQQLENLTEDTRVEVQAQLADRTMLEQQQQNQRQQRQRQQLQLAARPEGQHVRERHIRAAIENLMAAGLHEHAERLQQQLHRENEHRERSGAAPERRIRRVENQFEYRRDPTSDRQFASIQREMDEMRAQMRQMQKMMHELMRRSDRIFEERSVRDEHDDLDLLLDAHHDDDHDHHEDHDHDHDHGEDDDDDHDAFN